MRNHKSLITNRSSLAGWPETLVAVFLGVAASIFITAASGAILNDFRANLLQRFASNRLILLELLALTSSAVRHGSLPFGNEQIPNPKSQEPNPNLGFRIWGLGFGVFRRSTLR